MIALGHRYFDVSCLFGMKFDEKGSWDPKLLELVPLENDLLDGIPILTSTPNDSQVILILGVSMHLIGQRIFSNCCIGFYMSCIDL